MKAFIASAMIGALLLLSGCGICPHGWSANQDPNEQHIPQGTSELLRDTFTPETAQFLRTIPIVVQDGLNGNDKHAEADAIYQVWPCPHIKIQPYVMNLRRFFNRRSLVHEYLHAVWSQRTIPHAARFSESVQRLDQERRNRTSPYERMSRHVFDEYWRGYSYDIDDAFGLRELYSIIGTYLASDMNDDVVPGYILRHYQGVLADEKLVSASEQFYGPQTPIYNVFVVEADLNGCPYVFGQTYPMLVNGSVRHGFYAHRGYMLEDPMAELAEHSGLQGTVCHTLGIGRPNGKSLASLYVPPGIVPKRAQIVLTPSERQLQDIAAAPRGSAITAVLCEQQRPICGVRLDTSAELFGKTVYPLVFPWTEAQRLFEAYYRGDLRLTVRVEPPARTPTPVGQNR